MTYSELMTYYIPACRNIMGDTKITTAKEFDKLLGTSMYRGYNYDSRARLSEMEIQLLKLLAGPHGKAILKAYRIQKGLEP